MPGYLVPPTKNPGDVLTSALWNSYIRDNLDFGMVRPIADQTLGIAAATIDFTSIAATFAHLLLLVYGRTDRASAVDLLSLRFNNDSGANYYDEYLQAGAASPSAAEDLGITSGSAGRLTGAGAASADDFGGGAIFIPYYTSVHRHPWLAFGFASANTTTSNQILNLLGGAWKSAAAINRITLLPNLGTNFVAGSRVTLYGMGGT